MLDIQNNEACFEDPFTQIENCLLGIVSYNYIDTYYYYELVSTDLDDFIKKYDLYDNIFVDEEGYGITISYLTRFEKIE